MNPHLEFLPGEDQEEIRRLLKDFIPFRELCQRIKPVSVLIQSYDVFGSALGFVHLLVFTEARETLPIFLRGSAVAILPIFIKGEERYFLQVIEPRIPLGGRMNIEIPAGMSDGNGFFRGVAIRELEEETGIVIKQDELIDLGSYCTSCEYCDEQMHLYALERPFDENELKRIMSDEHGLDDELITLRLAPFDDIYRLTGSSTIIAAMRYEKLLAKKL